MALFQFGKLLVSTFRVMVDLSSWQDDLPPNTWTPESKRRFLRFLERSPMTILASYSSITERSPNEAYRLTGRRRLA